MFPCLIIDRCSTVVRKRCASAAMLWTRGSVRLCSVHDMHEFAWVYINTKLLLATMGFFTCHLFRSETEQLSVLDFETSLPRSRQMVGQTCPDDCSICSQPSCFWEKLHSRNIFWCSELSKLDLAFVLVIGWHFVLNLAWHVLRAYSLRGGFPCFFKYRSFSAFNNPLIG